MRTPHSVAGASASKAKFNHGSPELIWCRNQVRSTCICITRRCSSGAQKPKKLIRHFLALVLLLRSLKLLQAAREYALVSSDTTVYTTAWGTSAASARPQPPCASSPYPHHSPHDSRHAAARALAPPQIDLATSAAAAARPSRPRLLRGRALDSDEREPDPGAEGPNSPQHAAWGHPTAASQPQREADSSSYRDQPHLAAAPPPQGPNPPSYGGHTAPHPPGAPPGHVDPGFSVAPPPDVPPPPAGPQPHWPPLLPFQPAFAWWLARNHLEGGPERGSAAPAVYGGIGGSYMPNAESPTAPGAPPPPSIPQAPSIPLLPPPPPPRLPPEPRVTIVQTGTAQLVVPTRSAEVKARRRRKRPSPAMRPPPAVPGVSEPGDSSRTADASVVGWGIDDGQASAPPPVAPPAPPPPGLPAAWDARNRSQAWGHHIISGVRNQYVCNACVSFAVIAAAETAYALARRVNARLLDFSEHRLFFCDAALAGGATRQPSCSTGWNVADALAAVTRLGVYRDCCWPYFASWGARLCGRSGMCSGRELEAPGSDCRPLPGRWQALAVEWGPAARANASAAKEMVLRAGSAVACFREYSDMTRNRGTVYKFNAGISPRGYHCAQLVGWDDAAAFWLFKSSWGPEVGDKGFFKVGYGEVEVLVWGVYGLIWHPPPPPPAPAPASEFWPE